MTTEAPIVLISPDAKAALAAEVERGRSSGSLTGGLLFGYPLGKAQRFVVSSVRLSDAVGFGRRDFSLDQTRTSRQLEHARGLAPEANYCGIWYLHRTPNRELSGEEWVQTQNLLEDPDFPFEDVTCIVLCFYSAELTIYASSFNRHHSARSQAPDPTELRLTTDYLAAPVAPTQPLAAAPHIDWHRAPNVAARLTQERQRLDKDFHVEPALAPDGRMYFRLSHKSKYEKISFYFAIEQGFPGIAPNVFLMVGGKQHPLSTPSLGNWSPNRWLAELADELMQWLAYLLDEFMQEAENAFKRGNNHEAADLLTVVLAIEPRTPGAARLLAKAQAPL